MKKENKQRIYIDFLGYSGSGKTTIYNALTGALNSKEKKVAISGTDEFLNTNVIIRRTLPLLLNMKLSANLIPFFFNFPGKGKLKYKLFKSILIDYFLFETKNFKYYLNNGPLHYIGKIKDKKKLVALLKLYPGDTLYLVFVNTPPSEAYRRKTKRNQQKKKAKKIKNENPQEELFYFLKNNTENKVEKFIEIDGNKSVKENVEILKNEILKK
jgi:thymidylate kinase